MIPQPFPYAVNFRGFWACPCLAEWLPVFEAYLRHIGALGPTESLNIYQLIGGAPQSGSTHLSGGDWDVHPMRNFPLVQRAAAEMGSWLEPRYTWQGFEVDHDHGSLNGCPHESPSAKSQDVQLAAGEDGLLDHKRDGHPTVTRTLQQGIAWAKAQMEAPHMLTLVDASTNRPTPAAVKAAGHAGIIGYVSDYPVKNITKPECDAFIAAGLSVSLVWENGSQDAYGGFGAGCYAGKKAVAQAQALGCPKGVVLFAAADSNAANATNVGPYFQGWAQTVKAAGYLDGAYGDAAASHLCAYSWKVETWGTGDANLIQMVNAPIGPMPGTDVDEIEHDFPRWSAAFIARVAAGIAPALITQTMHELVMQIHELPASNEWGRRARIEYNVLRGLPGALTGHAVTAEPIHMTNARLDLKKFIETGVPASDQWGRRARLAYNAARGIN